MRPLLNNPNNDSKNSNERRPIGRPHLMAVPA